MPKHLTHTTPPPPTAGALVAAATDASLAPLTDVAARIRRKLADVEEAEQALTLRVLPLGIELLVASSRFQRGEFGPWLTTEVFQQEVPAGADYSKTAAWQRAKRYMEATRNYLGRRGITLVTPEAEIEGVRLAEIFDTTDLPGPKAKVREAVRAELAQTTLRQLLLGMPLEQPTPGGFQPPAADLAAWLTKHHPEHARAKWSELPELIQAEFRTNWKPKRTAQDVREDALSHCRVMTRQLEEFTHERPRPWTFLTPEELQALLALLNEASRLVTETAKKKGKA